MPQANLVVLNNGTADVKFKPNNKTNDGVFHFLNTEAGQADLMEHMSLSAISRMTGTSRGQLKIEVPKTVTDTDTGLKYSAGKAIAEISMKFPSNFTDTDRTVVYELLSKAIANATVTAVLKDSESVY